MTTGTSTDGSQPCVSAGDEGLNGQVVDLSTKFSNPRREVKALVRRVLRGGSARQRHSREPQVADSRGPNVRELRNLILGEVFSGYGGLDLAVEEVFGAETVWYSEINAAVARVFAHHWPDIPNLGDITTIDWTTVEPVDVIAGGFPCQDVSTAGRRAGLSPGTRTGLWAHMAAAIETLQPDG